MMLVIEPGVNMETCKECKKRKLFRYSSFDILQCIVAIWLFQSIFDLPLVNIADVAVFFLPFFCIEQILRLKSAIQNWNQQKEQHKDRLITLSKTLIH